MRWRISALMLAAGTAVSLLLATTAPVPSMEAGTVDGAGGPPGALHHGRLR